MPIFSGEADRVSDVANATRNDLPKSERLHGRGCVGRFFEEGRRGAAGKVVALALPNPEGPRRMAVVAGKKLGPAPLRSRLRRRLRAAYRTQKTAFPAGWDFVLMARPGLAEASWQDVMNWTRLAAGRAATAQAPTGPRPSRRRK